jgi:hypothetical protein
VGGGADGLSVSSLLPAMLALVPVFGRVGAAAMKSSIENVSALAPGTGRDIALDALRSIQRSRDGAGLTFALGLGRHGDPR